MNADTLRDIVWEHFRRNAAEFGLDPASLQVEYVLNWGGFVNYSYRVRDRSRSFHLKLSISEDDRDALYRLCKFAPRLERYHAPAVASWIDLGSAAGPLFEHVAGSPPALDATVVAEVLPVLGELNADWELAAALASPDKLTAFDEYSANFHRRFTEDLRGVRESPPPFVSRELVAWLDAQVMELHQAVAAAAAFSEPLGKPVHGDLWLNNLLWVNQNEWHLVDWDDLRIGDPATDIATLFGPTAEDLRPLKMLEHATGFLTSGEKERLEYLGRATLLDWVIDPLSDWIDADAAPAHTDLVRAEKERIHRQALALYRELYCTPEEEAATPIEE